MRVLIADDDRVSRRILSRLLKEGSFEVLEAVDGASAWQVIEEQGADLRLVVADWMMPGLTGLELVRKIRGAHFQHYIYTILLTSRSETEDRISGLAEGADDYVVKPFNESELLHRVRSGRRVVELQAQLDEKTAMLEQMVHIDGLTEIANRRAFDDAYARLAGNKSRDDRPFAILMIDIDLFKDYNDRFGHAAGDVALQRVATLLDQHLRGVDSVFRYGGEEFACLLPDTDTSAAERVGQRLRAIVEAEGIQHPTSASGAITVSVGVAAYEADGDLAPGAVLEAADRALYAAKELGRNRVCVPGDLEPLALAHENERDT